jgi:hypothetical protein
VALPAGQQGRLLGWVLQPDIDDEDRQQLRLACIETAFEHLQAGNGVGGDAQRLRAQAGQGSQRMGGWCPVGLSFGRRVSGATSLDRQGGQGQFEFGQANHGGSW